ncbi:heme A synthase [Cohnella pontilimi]|uniref:Heme A synthase n=1 Tax=Cohnella pontilimi TaxID=2564100 RepID=A0A4U0F752_9BACL|nr:COX15/CtaA family protein [Cohnella pontilimi]TJY39804.1 heme A synthase [Cohnella pontilimi]
MTVQRYKLLTMLTCLGMFLVLLVGVLVTNTDSGRGCGTDWPLCNGKFVPAYTVESLVEYSHRAVSGIVGLLIGATFLVTLMWRPVRRKEPVWYASAGLFFTFLQAALGAMAVVWPTSSAVLALHFGISLFAFTSTWLLYSYAKRLAATGDASESVTDTASGSLGRIPRSVFQLTAVILVYCYGVVYLGAYIRHTHSGGGCIGWPLCNGDVVPELAGATGIAFAHRIAAFVMLLLVVALVFFVRSRTGAASETTRLANISLWLVVLQVLSGGLLSYTLDNPDVYVFTSLLHTIIISALFSMLCLLALRARHLSRD